MPYGAEQLGNICEINEINTVKQNTYYFCAAASIKMSLDVKLSQEEIFKNLEENTMDKDNWYAEPDSVYNFLSKYKKFMRTSEISNSSIDAAEWILSSMMEYKSSAPKLVSGGKHWVVYSGYQMNTEGLPTGIYVRDPWPTTSSISFYPFCDYFFNDYFCEIDVDGKFKNKVESFVPSDTTKIIKIREINKPSLGGGNDSSISIFKNQIIKDDFAKYGFEKFGVIKNGGLAGEECTIYDEDNNPKFLLTYAEIDRNLIITAIEIKSNCVIGLLKAQRHHLGMFNKTRIINELLSLFGVEIKPNSIKFYYDKKLCSSCFDPIINVENLGKFNLSLEKLC